MRIKNSRRNLPFEDNGKKKNTIVKTTNPFSSLRKWNLSLRGTTLLACLMVSFSMLLKINEGFSLALVYVPLILILWRLTLAHIEDPNRIPLNYFLNSLFVSLFTLIPVVGINLREYAAFMPLILGITILPSMIGDGRVYYYDADWGTEVMLPLAAAFGSSLVAYTLTRLMFEKLLVSVLLFVGALLISASSFVLSKIYGKSIILSSEKNIQVPEGFISGRVPIILINILNIVFTTIYKWLVVKFSLNIPFVVAPFIGVIITTIFLLSSRRYRNGLFVGEAVLTQLIVLVVITYIGPVVAILADFLIVGFLASYDGYKLFTNKNKYFEGLPAIMVVLSIMLMIAEFLIKR